MRAAMAERLKASIEGDTERIASSMTDDYLQTDISGYVQDTPADFVRMLDSGMQMSDFLTAMDPLTNSYRAIGSDCS